ncbi:MAG: zf-HC2 domain-containing protein [Candidatus Omnitrophica bacterium]|nr:zf-HC2 domain-containing protein [Candidatus Omnitrophota bacterium]
MNCEEAAKLFYDYLDRELSPQDVAEVEAHIRHCKDCIGHLEFDKGLRRLLQKKNLAYQLPLDLKNLLMQKLKS